MSESGRVSTCDVFDAASHRDCRGAARAEARGSLEAAVPEPCQVTTMTPGQAEQWDEYVLAQRSGTFFHLAAWREAVKRTYGHEDLYLIGRRAERIVGVLPLFLVDSFLAGRMLVSVPYGVGGGVLADDDEAAATLLAEAKAVAGRRRCKILDLRSERAVFDDLPVVDRYVGFRRELPARAGEVLGWLPRKARAAARNARDKYKLTVHFGDEHLAEVWRLYTISMRRLGSLSYPYAFFERLVELTPGRHWTSIVRHKGQTVAGLVTFLFKDTVMPYFIGTTDQARRCSAANFIYLTVMERAVDQGYRVFDFGRSRRDNTGSYNFKRFCGFEPRPLGYQYYTPPGQKAPNLSPTNPKFRLARRFWPYLPLGIARPLGGWLSKHIPG